MSKQKHLKILIKNENDELEVISGKTKVLHIFAGPMVVQRLGQRLSWMKKVDTSDHMIPCVLVLKPKVQGEPVGRVEEQSVPELNPKVLGDLDGSVQEERPVEGKLGCLSVKVDSTRQDKEKQ